MKDHYQKHPRLSQLLDQLCEQSLDQEGADEISRIVKNDPAAREYYVRYLEIHSSLYWDLALPGTGQKSPQDSERLNQLVDRLLSDAAFEPLNLLPSRVRNDSTKKMHQQILKFGGVLSLLIVMLLGFWVVQERSEQVQIAKNPVPETQSEGSGVANNAATHSENSTQIDSTAKLPPRLPDIEWQQKSLAHSQSTKINGQPSADHLAEENYQQPLVADDQIVAAINRYIEQGWNDLAIMPSSIAQDHEWVRRIYLDLAGRIPTLQEVSQFEQDKRPDRERRLVDRLIASPSFSMNWSTRWTNLLVGRSPNARVDRFALQQYLRDSIVNNRPWSLVVSDLVSAQGDPRQNGATNFLVAHLNNQAVPATAFVARMLLGTQIHCAQCHKHPFYETTQLQFWELNSFFKQAKVVITPASEKTKASFYLTDKPIGGPTYFETRSGLMRVAYPIFNGHKVSDDKAISRREELARLLIEDGDPLVAQAFVNRTWSHLFGYGFTKPVDDLGPHNPPTHPELFKTLSQSFIASRYDVKRLVRWICLSRPYRLSSRATAENTQDAPDRGEPPAFSRMYFKPLTAEQLYDSLVAVSGHSPQTTKSWEEHLRLRESWTLQFVNSHDNDENDESDHFQGTITQALMMMNGKLMDQTISLESKLLAREVADLSVSDLDKFERICLAILSRKPRPDEIAIFRKLTRPLRDASTPDERTQMLATNLEDAMWAYLNSSEFIINH